MLGLIGTPNSERVFVADDTTQWHVLHTKSRQEKALSDDLAVRGIGHYLPLLRQSGLHGRRKVVVERPLFPGYVFLRGTLAEAYDADRTGRLANILKVFDQQQLNDELRAIYVALASGQDVSPHPFVRKGTPVTVRSGPFRGLRGVTESTARHGRLVLKLTTLGQAISVDIDAALLDPAD